MKDKLILDNLGLIYKVMQDMNCYIKDDEDFEEYYFAGIKGLIKGVKNYKYKETSSSYFYECIRREIFIVFKKNSAKKRIPKTHIYFLGDAINQQSTSYTFEDKIINKIDVELMLNKLKNKNYKKYLIEYYGIGTPTLTLQEIADKNGVSRQYVHQSIRRGLEKLKNIYLGVDNEKNKKINIKNKIKI